MVGHDRASLIVLPAQGLSTGKRDEVTIGGSGRQID